MVKKKKHDKDKYYQLARQQGYRARSAFKLIQLNKKYDFLSTARVCIDLCAAPGGWCQVAAKYMPASSIILGIDLLPIRPIRNVKTYVCDITTPECRQIIRKEMQTWQADVVLCDGAPNVGAEYSKDAFVQNELSLAALKLAVDVLGPHGTFVSKVFRSADYNALLWVFKQLFKKVSATKPLSSRNESAEIFVVCEDYLAPSSIDPKLLDPKYVFQQLDDKSAKPINIFHPKYGVQRRFREGYDESLGQTLRKVQTVGEFVECKDPVQALSETHELKFETNDSIYLHHKDTTNEIRICLQDLKVLGKSEFKMILKWRLKMRAYRESLLKAAKAAEEGKEGDEDGETAAAEEEKKDEEADPEEELQGEIRALKQKATLKKKKDKKKLRERMAKDRMRADLGMKNESVELPEHDKIFSLAAAAMTRRDIEGLAEVSLSQVNDPTEGLSSDEEDMVVSGMDTDDEEDDEEKAAQLERNMEDMYEQYQQRSSAPPQESLGAKAKKRSKIAKLALAGEAAAEDAALYDGDKDSYMKLLAHDQDSDEDSDSEVDEKDPLFADPLLSAPESNDVVTSRWFSSNPLFKEIEQEAEIFKTQVSALKRSGAEATDGKKKRKMEATSEEEWSDDVDGDKLPTITKILTEKEKRRGKRKVTLEKNARKEDKRRKMLDMDFDITAPENNALIAKQKSSVEPEDQVETEEQKKRKQMIRAGMGRFMKDQEEDEKKGDAPSFEVVEGLEVKDDRKYDSDHEFYDAEDYAKTLAIGTMMLNKTKAKDLVDASYNRFTWNDDESLPSWFVDDEEKHYKPQVPIPKAIMEKMREKFLGLATKPIKKVAEARMRKKRKLMKKVKVAKKKAEEIANMQDMTTREKAKAIDKAMKSSKAQGKKSKVYVVARKGGRTSSTDKGKKTKGTKVKFVDGRMKKDLRALKRAEKKKKGGKKSKH